MIQSQPIITSTTHTLPFDRLSPRDFERLCLWLVEREGFERVEYLGAAGSEQGRDIIAQREGKLWAFQCKRVQRFGPRDALKELEKVLALPDAQRPAVLVFIITRDVSADAREKARACCGNEMECYFWAGAELDEKVKRRKDIVNEFFGLPAITAKPESLPETTSSLPPKAFYRLVGRLGDLSQIVSALRDPERKPMIAIVGLGGIGKTALAREAADLCEQEKLFDYIVWTTAKAERFVGEGTIRTGVSDYSFDELLSDIGRGCDQAGVARMSPNEKRQAVKYLLASKRVLVVMDNLETVSESEGLVDGVFRILGQSKLLVTSRHRVTHDRIYEINLGGLSEDEGVVFLREEGKERGVEAIVQATRSRLAEVHQVTGGTPLAMKLVIGQVSRLPIGKVLKILKEARFEDQDYEFYRFVFRHSWDMLEPDAKKVLVSMSVFAPAIGGTAEMVKTVSMLEEPAFYRALDQLVLMSLADPLGDLERRRYSMHQLTYYFVLSILCRSGDRGAVRETVDWNAFYWHAACRFVDLFLSWYEESPALVTEDWLRAELLNLEAAIEHAAEGQKYQKVIELVDALYEQSFFEIGGYYKREKRILGLALDAAQQTKDLTRQLRYLARLGKAQDYLGKSGIAITYHQRALTIAWRLKDRHHEGEQLIELGVNHRQLGHTNLALRCYELALSISQSISAKDIEGICLSHMGTLYRNMGQLRRAIESEQRALQIAEELDDAVIRGARLAKLGVAFRNLGETDRSIRMLEEALCIAREVGDRRGEGARLDNLAIAYRNIGETGKAENYYKQAIQIAEETLERRAKGIRLSNLGTFYLNQGKVQEAIVQIEEALAIAREIGDLPGEGARLNKLGLAHMRLGRLEEAAWVFQQALEIARRVGDRRAESTRLGRLGDVHRHLGGIKQAIADHTQALEIAREIGYRVGEGPRLNGLGLDYMHLGEIGQAIVYFEQALQICREIKSPAGIARTLGNLGDAYGRQGDVDLATEYLEEAIQTAREIGDRETESMNSWRLGVLFQKQGDIEKAVSMMQVRVDYVCEIGHVLAEEWSERVEQLHRAKGE
jgi:tetratricopeptide (TPR) repeat protein